MEVQPIPGFDALRFKEEAQARVQAELAGLSPEETVRRIRELAEEGPLDGWWQRICQAADDASSSVPAAGPRQDAA